MFSWYFVSFFMFDTGFMYIYMNFIYKVRNSYFTGVKLRRPYKTHLSVIHWFVWRAVPMLGVRLPGPGTV